MSENKKAAKTDAHRAVAVSAATAAAAENLIYTARRVPFGPRVIPFGGSLRTAKATRVNDNPAFTSLSVAIGEKPPGRFEATESDPNQRLDGNAYQCFHGHLGTITWQGGASEPAMINTGTLPVGSEDCKAELKAAMDRLCEAYMSMLDSPQAFLKADFMMKAGVALGAGKSIVSTVKGLLVDLPGLIWDGVKKKFNDYKDLAVEAMKFAEDPAAYTKARGAEAQAQWNAAKEQYDKLSQAKPEDIKKALMEVLEGIFGTIPCSAAAMLDEMTTDPRGVHLALGELTGQIGMDVVTTIGTGGTAAAVKGGAAAGRLSKMAKAAEAANDANFLKRLAILSPGKLIPAITGKLGQAGKAGQAIPQGGKVAEAAKAAGKAETAVKPAGAAKAPAGSAATAAKKAESKPAPTPPAAQHDSVQGKPQGESLLECVICPTKGAPVNPVLGIKSLGDALDLDFNLPAPLPLPWQRFYSSRDPRIGLLGQGWSLPLSLQLEPRQHETVLVDRMGRRIICPVLSPGQTFYSLFEHFHLRRGPVCSEGETPPDIGRLPWDENTYELEYDDGERLLFRPPRLDDDPTRFAPWPVRAKLDRNDYAIYYQYDAAARLILIGDSAERLLQLVYTEVEPINEDDNGLRLTGVALLYDPARDAERPTSQRDPATYSDADWLVRYRFDDSGDLVEVIDSVGRIKREFGYRQHLMIRHGQPGGLQSHYEYDRYVPEGQVVRHWIEEGLAFRFDYQDDHTRVTDNLDRTTIYHFKGQGDKRRWIGTTHPDGASERFEYDRYGNLLATFDAVGRRTQYRLDGKGRPILIDSPGQASISLHYDSAGQVIEQSDGEATWRYAYDRRGNLLESINPLGYATRYVYGDAGLPDRPTEVIDAKGGVKRLQWDRRGLLTSYTDCSNKTTRHYYDAMGQLVAVTNALGQTVSYRYDTAGRLIAAIQPDGATERFAYDAQDRLIGHRNPAGVDTLYTLDRLGRVLARRNGLGHSLRYEYDVAGRLTRLINENGVDYLFQYDVRDRLIHEQAFDDRTFAYGYDLTGELIERIEYPGTEYARRIAYRRDSAGRLIEKHTGTGKVRYQYDERGQMIQARNEHSQVAFTYDALGQTLSETSTVQGETTTLQYRYDALGNRTAMILPDGRVLNWLYYGSGHLHQVNLDGEVICDFERDDLHREIWRRQGALESRFAYDEAGRLAWQGVFEGQSGTENPSQNNPRHDDPTTWEALGGTAGAAKFARSYRYDVAGRLTEILDSRHGSTRYRYDDIDRLLSASHPNGLQEVFAFDPAHNLLDPMEGKGVPEEEINKSEKRLQDTGLEFKEKIQKLLEDPSWNPLLHPIGKSPQRSARSQNNRLRVYEDKRFDYDVYGNLIEKRIGRHTVMRFEYDGDHQMVAAHVTRNGVLQTTRYAYDPFGRRITKSDALSIIYFIWDGDRLLSEIREEKSFLFVYQTASFVPLAQIEALGSVEIEDKSFTSELVEFFSVSKAKSSASQHSSIQFQAPQFAQAKRSFLIHYYHSDHLGTPQEISNKDGVTIWQANYQAWGANLEVERFESKRAKKSHFIFQPFRFQGQYLDKETGLHYNRYRYYDPDIGRFFVQDPVGLLGGNNLYTYAFNPISWVDPLGLTKGCAHSNGMANAAQYSKLKEYLRIEELKSYGFYKAGGGRIEADYISAHAFSRHQYNLGRIPNQNRTQFDEHINVAKLRLDTMSNPDRYSVDPHTLASVYEKAYSFDITPSNMVDLAVSPVSSQSSRIHKVFVSPDPEKSTQFPLAPRHC